MIRSTARSIIRFAQNLVDTPAVILLYHRVAHLSADPQLLSVDPENFYDHISLLRSRYTLLTIEEFSELVNRREKMPARSVVVTFDDGYADNYLEALPILETLQSQALFYITTSKLDTPYELWWDELERIFLQSDARPLKLDLDIEGRRFNWPTANERQRTHTYHALHPLLKFLQPDARDSIIGQLQQWASLDKPGRPTHRMLTFDQLEKMGRSNSAVIGAHTHRHPALSALSQTDQQEEIHHSRDILENLLHRKIDHFSYPFGGKTDYNRDSVAICRAAGFRLVCSNIHGQAHRWTDPLQVPRILVRNWNKDEFARRLSKFFIS